jgi:hypothetical protein
MRRHVEWLLLWLAVWVVVGEFLYRVVGWDRLLATLVAIAAASIAAGALERRRAARPEPPSV